MPNIQGRDKEENVYVGIIVFGDRDSRARALTLNLPKDAGMRFGRACARSVDRAVAIKGLSPDCSRFELVDWLCGDENNAAKSSGDAKLENANIETVLKPIWIGSCVI